jgi:predicted esterase
VVGAGPGGVHARAGLCVPGRTAQMIERHIKVSRLARYYTLGPPAIDAAEAWFVLHGYRQLAGRFLRRFEGLDDGSRRIVAPEALSRFYLDDGSGPHGRHSRVGATWMTREDREREIEDYVAYLDAVAHRELAGGRRAGGPLRSVVLGFSQGAATASRWAVYGMMQPDDLILWAGLPAHDLDRKKATTRLEATRVSFVVGSEDRFRNDAAVAEQVAWLREAGIDCRVVTYDGDHRVDSDALLRLV